jgi:hypothetical protein
MNHLVAEGRRARFGDSPSGIDTRNLCRWDAEPRLAAGDGQILSSPEILDSVWLSEILNPALFTRWRSQGHCLRAPDLLRWAA